MMVAVTGVHAGCQRSPGLAVARSLAMSGQCKVIAIDYDDLSAGLQAPEFCGSEVIPWSADSTLLLNRLKGIGQMHQVDVIIPCLNSDAVLFAEIADDLAAAGMRSLLPTVPAFEKRTKPQLLVLSRSLGLRHPRTIVCWSSEDLDRARVTIGFPCVVKGHECGVFPVRNAELFDYYASYCAANFDYPLLVQEWIEGEEYSVMGLCDRESVLHLSVAVKKLGIGDDGESWMSVIVDAPLLLESLQSLTKAINWVGPIECDFVRNESGCFLFDVNPRFPAWVDGPASLGFNVPMEAVSLVNGLACRHLPPPASGTVFYKDFRDVFSTISDWTSATGGAYRSCKSL